MSHLPIRPKIFIFPIAAVLLLFSGNCSRVSQFLKSADPFYTTAYREVCETWSRDARIHRGLEVELIVSATYKSEEFRRAYADEYAEAYQLTPEAKKQFVEDQLEAAAHGYEFVMASFVPEEKWDDFHRANSMWKIYLVNDQDERVVPVEVRQLKRQGKAQRQGAVRTHFFPYDTPWKSLYTVRFPYKIPTTKRPVISGDTKRIKLVIASVVGTAEMEWELEGLKIEN
jgi:hypothetical protein